MEQTKTLEELSIYQIYLESQETKTYVIPIYQRNYAWEENEITTLINDVYDSFKSAKKKYYIGTLVTYKRGNSVYEVIDGQQRLTTIYIILKALGIKNEEIRNKLTYGARKASASTIENLDKFPNLGDMVDDGISNGYKFALNAIETVEEPDRENFKHFFLNNVHVIYYRVPKDVDLNHYFEVMNSRGEQLEKHEIVKSMLSQHLSNKDLAIFSRVWEACSEMNIYIQQAFPKAEKIFGSNLDKFKISSYENIPEQEESEGKAFIMDLFQQPISKMEVSSDVEKSDKFQPIIDFPNFLLIVLKVMLMKKENFDPTNFTLDDKVLLDVFKNALNNEKDKGEFARQYAFNLLKAKYLLDNYIVHHTLEDKERSDDNPWKLQLYYCEKDTQKKYPKNISDDKDLQKELVHLLSMFEVSFSPKQRKNYLFYCMMFLFDKGEPKVQDYLEFLRQLADKYFYNVYLNSACLNEKKQPGPKSFDNAMLKNGQMNVETNGHKEIDNRIKFEEIYQQGKADVPLFVFNYTDYILWKKYADELRSQETKKGDEIRTKFFDELGCSDFGLDPFKKFYFSRTRKSLEHYFPQAKAGKGKFLSTDEINCFGNFAMIGAEANSSGSYLDPIAKTNIYIDGKYDQVSVASLKFKIMMQKCKDNDLAMQMGDLKRDKHMEWNYDDIQDHQRKMLDIIF